MDLENPVTADAQEVQVAPADKLEARMALIEPIVSVEGAKWEKRLMFVALLLRAPPQSSMVGGGLYPKRRYPPSLEYLCS